jgi:transposase
MMQINMMQIHRQTPLPPPPPPPPAEPTYAALVAIDWADQKHTLVLRATGSATKESRPVEHTPEALSDWVAALRARFPGGQIALILEPSRGALINALMPHDHLDLYPINPRMSAKFREAFYPSKSKNDPLDTDRMLDILAHHRDRLTVGRPDEETTRQLPLLVEARRTLVADQVDLSNRLTSTLKSYFPQALVLAGEDLTSTMACAFIQKWNTLESVQKVKDNILRSFYYGHPCRAEDPIKARLQWRAQAQPLTPDPAVIAAQSLRARTLAAQLAVLPKLLAEYDRQIARLFAQHIDYAIWDSFPGAGPVLAPRLAAAWGTQRDRFEASQAMSRSSGIAPVKEASGQREWIHFRLGCPKFLRQTFHEMAFHSLKFCVWAACDYQLQRERGKGHHAAIRALAFKWQRIRWRCWQDKTPYDEAQYLTRLQRTSATLYARIMAVKPGE